MATRSCVRLLSVSVDSGICVVTIFVVTADVDDDGAYVHSQSVMRRI